MKLTITIEVRGSYSKMKGQPALKNLIEMTLDPEGYKANWRKASEMLEAYSLGMKGTFSNENTTPTTPHSD